MDEETIHETTNTSQICDVFIVINSFPFVVLFGTKGVPLELKSLGQDYECK